MTDLSRKPNTLRRKLFGYMFLLAMALILTLLAAMFLLGQIPNVKQDYQKTLDMHTSALEKEFSDYYENAVLAATQFSFTAGQKMDALLSENNISFSMLENNRVQFITLQDQLFEPLKNSLLQANTSGAFLIWDTTINSNIEDAEHNRNGLYLQLNTKSIKESTVIVYRGDAETAKKHGTMPHRKWRLEYSTAEIPNYAAILNEAAQPVEDFNRISPVFELPGTSEKVVLITVPILGKDGTVYGLCGFELCQTYFKEHFSQPTNLGRLTCLFVPEAEGPTDTRSALSCGVQNGYYYVPTEALTMEEFSSGLTKFTGESGSYIGVSTVVHLTGEDNPSRMVLMIPKEDYDQTVLRSILVVLITGLLLCFFAVVVCMALSHRFILPIHHSLQLIRKSAEADFKDNTLTSHTGVHEIDELIALLKDKMQKPDDREALPAYMENMLNRFIKMTEALTPSEMNALALLIHGHDPKELPKLLFVSESTAKHHVLKIYKKLQVSSKGELLLYIDLLKGCGMIDQICTSE